MKLFGKIFLRTIKKEPYVSRSQDRNPSNTFCYTVNRRKNTKTILSEGHQIRIWISLITIPKSRNTWKRTSWASNGLLQSIACQKTTNKSAKKIKRFVTPPRVIGGTFMSNILPCYLCQAIISIQILLKIYHLGWKRWYHEWELHSCRR